MSHALSGNGNGHCASDVLAKPASRRSSVASVATESLVKFLTSEGEKLCGAPVRLTQHSVVFEIHGGGAELRISEVLADFQITNQGQTLYCGRAVICNLVEGGSKLICEATLEEACWTDFAFKQALRQEGRVEAEFGKFLREWQGFYKITPEFKIVIADIQCFLGELQVWLDRLEMATKASSLSAGLEKKTRLVEELEARVLSSIGSLTDRLENVLNGVERAALPSHWIYCRRLLHPFTLSSPFMHRAFIKPFGYAGDHEVVAMMFRDRFQGDSLFAQLLNSYALHLLPITAHKNRIEYLTHRLQDEVLRSMTKGKRTRMFSLGCGPAKEAQFFLEKNTLSDQTEFTLSDFNEEALNETSRTLNEVKMRFGRQTRIKTIKSSVQQLLKDAAHPARRDRLGRFEFVYCAGLFDYLPDRTCQQLMEVFFEMLQPDGLLVVTNVDNHQARNQMECFLDWQLIYRTNEELKSLSPKKADPEKIGIRRDPSGVNVFLEIRK